MCTWMRCWWNAAWTIAREEVRTGAIWPHGPGAAVAVDIDDRELLILLLAALGGGKTPKASVVEFAWSVARPGKDDGLQPNLARGTPARKDPHKAWSNLRSRERNMRNLGLSDGFVIDEASPPWGHREPFGEVPPWSDSFLQEWLKSDRSKRMVEAIAGPYGGSLLWWGLGHPATTMEMMLAMDKGAVIERDASIRRGWRLRLPGEGNALGD